MPYSSLPIPNIPSTRIIDQDFTIYLAPPDHWAGKTGSTSNWTGYTYGNDSTGDGTLAKPYATLKKAWEAAQGYIIQGNAKLYIQFQKGIYGYTFDPADRSTNPFPERLYHPQGENIIIQGDPEALKQRYLYRVKDYVWDISRASYFGHTGTVNLWRSQHAYGDTAASHPTGNGTTAHGFTGEDVFGYVAISNAAQGVPQNRSYVDGYNGVHTNSKYAYQIIDQVGHNWFRSQLNHGLSYEEAGAVCGIARIEGATSDAFDLRLQFKNFNLDGRIHTYPLVTSPGGSLGGCLGNGLSFAGSGGYANIIPANYPEPQYGVPNGFYGPTYGVGVTSAIIDPAWNTTYGAVAYGTGPNITLTYPARAGGDVHITDDPHILTNYPVVIKVYSSSTVAPGLVNQQKPIPLFLDGCRVGSVRNIMFVNGDTEARSRTVAPQGGTLAPCNGFDHDYTVAAYADAYRGRATQCLLMTNGSMLSIRHVGMVGWGCANNQGIVSSVSVSNRSQLWSDTCIDFDDKYTTVGNTTPGNPAYWAELGRLYNSPVLMIFGGGIDTDNASVIDFYQTGASYYGRTPKTLPFAQSPVWIHSLQRFGLVCSTNSQTVLGPTTILNYGPYPAKFRMNLNLPVIPGGTVFGGVSAQFLHPSVFEDAGGRGVTYTSIIGYTRTPTTFLPFARFFVNATVGGTFAHSNLSGTGKTGWGNSGVVWTANNNAGVVTLPTGFSAAVQNQQLTMIGVKLYDHGIDSAWALSGFVNAGNTLEFYAYRDQAEGVTVADQFFAVGKNGAVIRTPSGVTIAATDAGWGYTYAFGGPISDPGNLYENNDYSYGLLMTNGSVCDLQGCLTISGKAYLPLHITGEGVALKANASHISVQGGSHSQILVERAATFNSNSGSIIAKNPQPFGINETANPWGYGIYVRQGGKFAAWSPIVCIGTPLARLGVVNAAPTNSGVGLGNTVGAPLTTIGAAYGANSVPYGSPFYMQSAANVNLSGAGYHAAIFAWDGGVDGEGVAADAGSGHRIGGMFYYGQLYGNRSICHLWNTAQGAFGSGVAGSGTVKIMTRGSYGTNGNTAAGADNSQQLLYNSPRGASAWFVLVGAASQGTTGWVGPRSGGLPLTPQGSGTVRNLAFVDTIYWSSGSGVNNYGAAVDTTNPQRLGAGVGPTADPPGYTGPGFFVSADSLVNTLRYGSA